MQRFQELPSLTGRFVSEFGMEAYPHLTTVKSAITSTTQQYPGSMTMDFHNRAIDHERRVLTYVAENFQLKYDLASFTHLTQLTQANVMTWAYRSWRRDWGRAAARKCGGALVWQLDDCWPTMSWAVVDYYLVKKPAFYAIKRAMAPLAVGVARPFHDWTAGHVDPTIAATDPRYDVWVASSRTEHVTADVVVRFISIKTGQDIAPALEKANVSVHANGTTEVLSSADQASSTTHQSHRPFDPDTHDPYVVYASLVVDGVPISTDAAWPQPFKYLDFSDRHVAVTLSHNQRSLTVTAQNPIHGFVFEEKRDWITFSDNGFDVMPGVEKVVEIEGPSVQKEDISWTYLGADRGSLRL